MQKKAFVLALVGLLLGALPTVVNAYGAAHVGYTHVGPNGVYHTGATAYSGPGGVRVGGQTTGVGYGGAAYHTSSGAAVGYGGSAAYRSTSVNTNYRYAPRYGGGATNNTVLYGYVR